MKTVYILTPRSLAKTSKPVARSIALDKVAFDRKPGRLKHLIEIHRTVDTDHLPLEIAGAFGDARPTNTLGNLSLKSCPANSNARDSARSRSLFSTRLRFGSCLNIMPTPSTAC